MSFLRIAFSRCIVLTSLFVSFTWSFPVQHDSLTFQQEAERLFQRGVERFSAGAYRDALADFQQVVQQPRNHRLTAAYLMAAKAHYFVGSHRESIRLLRAFFDLYPESSYTDDGHYTLGLNYHKLRRNEEAAAEFLIVMQTADERNLVTRSEEWLKQLAGSSLNIGHIQLLLAEATTDEAKALLSVHLAEKIFRSGDAETAEEIILPIAEMSPHIRAVGDAVQLLERIRKGGVLKIGVLLPLMLNSTDADEQAAGEDLLAGVRLAVEEHNQVSFPKLSLEIRDTEYNPNVAMTRTAELCTDNDIVAIVGPALSEEARMSAAIAESKGIPLISPTATAKGIAETGTYIFQANPDLDVRGRAMAQYALSQLGARTVAVLAPNNDAGRAQAEAFLAEATMYGAEVVDVQWYEPGATNHQPQFMEIRRKSLERMDRHFIDFTVSPRSADVTRMLQWGIPQQTIDTLVFQSRLVPVDSLFGGNGKLIADSLRIPVHSIDMKLDSLHIPVENLDALFLPIAGPEDIAVISSQVRYFNFQSALLGGGEWNDIIELDQNRRYTNNIYFLADRYWREDDEAYRSFSARYQEAYGTVPSLNVLYTYDTMKMLVKVISETAHDRASIAEALAGVRGYQGIHSKISFTERRVNGVVTILQFKNRGIVRINEVDMATGRFWSGQD
ncbi:MAG TPA: penicillin-binding protein activator [Bacteroidota bacterium]